ncbi:MAG: GUN4 domain-containing protein [Nostoc sp. DedQUE11]|nr:GUN4 domain-containing protein [Nostoc sp. DedQUE11]
MYNDGRFGFSVQKRIWESADIHKGYQKFSASVGWGTNAGWRIYSYMNRISYDKVNFNTEAPEGHLPVDVHIGSPCYIYARELSHKRRSGPWGAKPGRREMGLLLEIFSRIETCKV